MAGGPYVLTSGARSMPGAPYMCPGLHCPKKSTEFRSLMALHQHQQKTPACVHLELNRLEGRIIRDKAPAVAAAYESGPDADSQYSITPPPTPILTPTNRPPTPVRKGRAIPPDRRATVEDCLDDDPGFTLTAKDLTIPAKLTPEATFRDDYKRALSEMNIAIGGKDAPLHPFSPYSSELDWGFSSWLIDEGIGYNASESLYKLPGVCIFLSTTLSRY